MGFPTLNSIRNQLNWFNLHCIYRHVEQVPDTHRIPRTSPVYLIPHTVICSEAWPSWASAQWPRRASYAIAIHAINQWAPPMAAPPAWTPITRSSIGTTWVQNHQCYSYIYISIYFFCSSGDRPGVHGRSGQDQTSRQSFYWARPDTNGGRHERYFYKGCIISYNLNLYLFYSRLDVMVLNDIIEQAAGRHSRASDRGGK